MGDLSELDFESWLHDNTELSEGSIKVYVRTIRRYFAEFDDFSISNVNKFVSDNLRKKNNYYFKFAFKSYLDYVGKPELYDSIVSVSKPPKKKLGNWQPREVVEKVIGAISDERLRDMALLQYGTISRARGILTLHDDRVDMSDDLIRIGLVEKGGVEKPAVLRSHFKEILNKYLGKGYLFLPKGSDKLDPVDLNRVIDRERTYYYVAVRKAANVVGVPNFGTHDIRRSAGQTLVNEVKNPKLVQKIMRHSDFSTTMIYFDAADKDADEAMLKHQGQGD